LIPVQHGRGRTQHPLGHLTYLEAKAEGESSMSGKAETSITVNGRRRSRPERYGETYTG